MLKFQCNYNYMANYIPLIGLEIHVQLKTETKLFCACPRKSDKELYATESDANTNVCPVCLALPGAMPFLNKEAVEKAIKLGLGLNCTVNDTSIWDRKNYFYPDLFTGYQISQLDYPVNSKGYVDISNKRIRINRAHLENDAAKSLHGGDYTLLDANKSGSPMVEVVSEPDMRSTQEAYEYAQKVREIARWIGVSDADMYHGEMKFDINVSICVEGDPDKDGLENIKHTPIAEVKNRNSFKELLDVINYEIKRQTEEYEKNGTLYTKGSKVTMGWDEAKGKTTFQREKEEADDYRYFHEPDVPPVSINEEWREKIRSEMPESMNSVIDKLVELHSADKRTITQIVSDRDRYNFFLKCSKVDSKYTKNYINWIATEIEGVLTSLLRTFDSINLEPATLVNIVKAVADGKINQNVGRELLKECIEKNVNLNIEDEISKRGLGKLSDTSKIEEMVKKVINDNPKVVEDINKGKESAKMSLIGSVMRESQGKADVNIVKELLDKLLK